MKTARSVATWAICLLAAPLVALTLFLATGNDASSDKQTWCSNKAAAAPAIDCYEKHFAKLVAANGLPRSLAQVDEIARHDRRIAGYCHLAWHPIGEAAGRRDATTGTPPKQLNAHDSNCQEGYLHGYLIGYLAKRAQDITPQDVVDLCITPNNDRRARGNCVHAVGHVFGRTDNVETATKRCGSIDPPDLDLAFDCMHGMFMEAGLRELAAGKKQPDGCAKVPEAAYRACLVFLPARAVGLSGKESSAVTACEAEGPRGFLCAGTVGQLINKPAICDLFAEKTDQARCSENLQPAPVRAQFHRVNIWHRPSQGTVLVN